MTVASWVELSNSAYASNVATFRGLTGGCKLGAVLKGNAYGHGLTQTLSMAHALVDVLYVITVDEALAIREWEAANRRPRKDVLVIGAVSADDCVQLALAKVSVVASDAGFQSAVAPLRAARLTLDVHLHLDTGLGREGFTFKALSSGAADFFAAAQDVLQVSGVLSHFANTEDVTEQDYAKRQLVEFERGFAVFQARASIGAKVLRHFAASAAALVLPMSRIDVVRVGIGLYGLWPSAETKLSARVVLGTLPDLQPVLSWKAPSQVVKWVPAQSFVGYGCTYRCAADTRVAVLPVGYWDGYPRAASGKAHALVDGKRCAVLGRVMMNHLIVDVTHAVNDESPLVATLLGRDGGEVVSAENLSAWAQTLHYETITRLGPHLKRLVVA